MAERSAGQQLARRRLGNALRKLREDANIRIDVPAKALECSTAKISRIENGLGPAKQLEVRALLDLYGVTDEAQRSRFEDWASATKEPGWWEADADLIEEDDELILAIETAAARYQNFCTPVIPTMLQTLDYAKAHIRAHYPKWSDADVLRLAQHRMTRQQVITRAENPLNVDVVIDEGSLRRRVGSRSTQRDQLATLLRISNEYPISLRVLPFDAGIPGIALNPFTIYQPRNPRIDPVVAFSEGTVTTTRLEAREADILIDLFTQLSAMSLAIEDSRATIRRHLDELA